MVSTRFNQYGRRLATVLVAVLVLAAALFITLGLRGHAGPPPPSAAAARPTAEGNLTPIAPLSSQSAGAANAAVVGPILPRSLPKSLSVPAIGLENAELVAYGTDAKGAIDIPPAEANTPAGWFTGSPTPGEQGPSVIVGHVDSAAAGPSVFYRLGQLKPGDKASITLQDRTTAVFVVDSVEEYHKAEFPTLKVYGNIDHAGLRLITCGGKFNRAVGHYEDNIVVYAHLVSSHTA